jgi:hypothetical protein
MSFQRPGLVNGSAGPSSASYSEFLKDIYSGLRALSTGVATINTRLDTLTQQLQSFDARLERQDQISQTLADRMETIIQQHENSQIRQTTSGLSLLSELDTLGSRQVEPSIGLSKLGLRTDKLMSSNCVVSKLSFQLPGIPELSGLNELPESGTVSTGLLAQSDATAFSLQQIPDVIIHEQSTGLLNNEPSAGVLNSPEPVSTQLGTNFLILD